MAKGKLIDKSYSVHWNGNEAFGIISTDGSINAEVIFYKLLDSRNKVTGKGSRKFRHGILVACHLYKEVRTKGKLEGKIGGSENVGSIRSKIVE